jgi:hypothetical protein
VTLPLPNPDGSILPLWETRAEDFRRAVLRNIRRNPAGAIAGVICLAFAAFVYWLAGDLPAAGFSDGADHFAFHAEAGQSVHLVVRGVAATYAVLDADGVPVHPGTFTTIAGVVLIASHDEVVPVDSPEVTIVASGLHFLVVASSLPQQYRFSIGLDAPAPEPGYQGHALPPLPACWGLLSDPVCSGADPVPGLCRSVFSDALCRTLEEGLP